MRFSSRLREAAGNLVARPLRSFLALLGILVGTASVLAIVSGGELATEQALQQFEQLGTNLVSVVISYDYAAPGKNVDYLELSEILDLPDQFKQIDILAPYIATYVSTSYKGKYLNASVAGVGDNLFKIAKLDLLQGRFISLLDEDGYFCVLGYKVYKNLKVDNALGLQVLVGKQYFTVVGVLALADENPYLNININNAIFIPLQTAHFLTKNAYINNILLNTTPGTNVDELRQGITEYIKSRADAHLYFESSEIVVKNMRKQRQIFTVFLGFIGGISLLVGGIGVMNIMLISISERCQEIGIRMAVGARRIDILFLFLVEAVILALLGGGLGVIVGEIVTLLVAEVKHWGFHIFLFPLLLGFSVSMLTGVFFGFYPAFKASKLKPIETLRTE